MNIPKTSGSIAIKFCLKHHWVRKAAFCFVPDRIRALVSMATFGYNGGNGVATFSFYLFFFLKGNI